jgi:hypothetical protein
MSIRLVTIFVLFTHAAYGLSGQTDQVVKLSSTKKNVEVLPGQIINLAFFAENTTEEVRMVQTLMNVPPDWKLISASQKFELKPAERKFLIFTVQIPSTQPVGEYLAKLTAGQEGTGHIYDSLHVSLKVGEVEKIELHLVESPAYIRAGEEFRSEFLLHNLGNTVKKVYIETRNCTVEGNPEVEISPGNSVSVFVINPPNKDLAETVTNYYTVRALLSGEVAESIFKSYLIFPVKEKKEDFYFRFPVELTTTYLATNQGGKYEHIYQFELAGNGSLDEKGKHRLDFLARGPNSTNLSFLGMYDQYYISYANSNLELFAGEKSFMFTPLTESSRFGMGAETKVKFNNGLNLGFLYVKPRFYKEISNEMAAFTGIEFNEKNSIALYLISKQTENSPDLTQLASINSHFQPFERTSAELEISRGQYQNTRDNALRANISSQFWVFNINGNYFYTGKNYPGYFSNSSFYSGNVSVNLTRNMSLGLYAKEDFLNAQLDTFFVTAPYSKSIQSTFSYNIASRAHLRFYWRQYERKDRLALNKFHYKSNSVSSQFSHNFKKFNYSITGEYGNTTNFLLEQGENQQNMYRGSMNLAYQFARNHAVRFFGSWSNINRFISADQQNITAGMSVASQISKSFRANFHLQNAYDIEEYYRNRNLMQLNLDFTPGTKHQLSLRSFYTLFRQETENPELTFSLNYTYKFGIPLKKVVKAGDISGRIVYDNDEPAVGIMVTCMNKTAITNNNGEFRFQSVQVGRHLLFVDRSGLAIDEIPEIADHFEVDILEDQSTLVFFKITKGAKLTGNFEVQKTGMSVLQKEEISVQNIIIELKNEQEQFRIMTDKDGKFEFPLVRPGEWSFRIYTNSLPEGFEIKESLLRIEFLPGQNKVLPVILIPKKRTIIFKSDDNILQPLKPLNNAKTKQD